MGMRSTETIGEAAREAAREAKEGADEKDYKRWSGKQRRARVILKPYKP